MTGVLPPGSSDQVLAALYGEPPSPYLNDPVGWARDKLGRHLWSKQREAAESVVTNRFTAVQSCHNAGKSLLGGGVLAAWWIDVHPPGTALVVTTAPHAIQLGIVWRELGRAHVLGELPGEVLDNHEWKREINGRRELVALGRKPADHDEHGFQGWHEDHVLVIIDEACGIPESLWTAVDAVMTAENHRAIALGNPDDPTSQFEQVCAPGSKWNTIRIDGLQMPTCNTEACEAHPELAALLADAGLEPNDEEIPEALRGKLLAVTWILESLRTWGKDDPRWQSKVRGLFPNRDDLSVFPRECIDRALATDLSKHANDPDGVGGLDVADVGKDETVLYQCRGGWIRRVFAYTGRDTTHTESEAGAWMRQNPLTPVWVDAIGTGAGVFNRLRLLGFDVHRFIASAAAKGRSGQDQFANLKAQAHFALRDGMKHGEVDLDPADTELLKQLRTIRWTWDAKGRIMIESKDERKKRKKRSDAPSPDRVDGVVMAYQRAASRERAKQAAERARLEAAANPGRNGSLTANLRDTPM